MKTSGPYKYPLWNLLVLFFILINSRILTAQTITSFTPDSITAGTGSVLTINGTGFGNTGPDSTHFVEFTSADVSDGPGFIKHPVVPDISDYNSWTNTQIKVMVPDHAGTGVIGVVIKNDTNFSKKVLVINYAIENYVGYNGLEIPLRMINANGFGGYTFQLEHTFDNDVDARNLFIKALNEWKCAIGVNWALGSPTWVNQIGDDKVNVIKFDTTGDDVVEGAYGEAFIWCQMCGDYWATTGVDIVFASTNVPWSDSEEIKLPLHELGHALGLDHVNNPDVMSNGGGDPNTYNGPFVYQLSPNDINGGKYAMALSTDSLGCSSPMKSIPAGSCDLQPPVITSFSPDSAEEGDTLTIIGSNFNYISGVSLGGVLVNSYFIISPTTIKVIVGDGESGSLEVGTPGGIAYLSGFIYLGTKQTISFSKIPAHEYGDSDFNPEATSSSGLPLTYTSSNSTVATIVNGKIHIVGAGTVTITASQAGNSDFAQASNVSQTLNVSPATLTIKANNQTRLVGQPNPTLTVSYSGFVNGEGTSSLTEQPVITTSATSSSPAGTYAINVSGAQDANYTFNYISGVLTVQPIPTPVITSVSPENAIIGTTVTITGKNLSGTTSVSFGGIPASSFTVVSSTTITAVVGSGSSGSVSVTTPYGTNTMAGFNFVFSLPVTNFKISTTAATCLGVSDGEINIEAVQKLNYTALVSSKNLDTTLKFADSLSINNLSAGTYQVCLTVKGQPGYQQCYNLTINQPKPLSAYAVVNPAQHSITITLEGGNLYHIMLGDKYYSTTNNQITLPLPESVHLLMISTDKGCQGIVTKQINIPSGILTYPNPFSNQLNIDLGKKTIAFGSLQITDISTGRIIFRERLENQSGTIQLNTSDFETGVYALTIDLDHINYVFKIIKVEN